MSQQILDEMHKRIMNFDDVEFETDIVDKAPWGSDASRKTRQRAVNKLVRMVKKNPSILDKYPLRSV